MGPPRGVHALLSRSPAGGRRLASARSRLFPGLLALSLLLTLAGLAILLLREALTGGIFMALGSLDLALVLTARQGARRVRCACYRHRSGQVLAHLREFLRFHGTAYADGRSLRFPLGGYRSLRIPAWAISVGVLEINRRRSLVLLKGVNPGNEGEALRLLRALDSGLFRADERLGETLWV